MPVKNIQVWDIKSKKTKTKNQTKQQQQQNRWTWQGFYALYTPAFKIQKSNEKQISTWFDEPQSL